MSRTWTGPWRLLAAFAVLGLIAIPLLARADNTVADGDGVTPIGNNDMAFGNVCVGVSTAKTALVVVERLGAVNPQTVANSAAVTISVQSVTGTGLSAVIVGSGVVILPATWTTIGNNVQSASVSSTVTLIPASLGPGSGSVVYRGEGAGATVATVSRDDTMLVSWNGIDCTPADTTPPVITPSVSGTLGNNGWYTSDVTVSWTVVDNESTVTSTTGCGTTVINYDTTGVTLTCSATSAGGTNSESVTIKRDATQPTISGSASPAPNVYGWNNSDVFVAFTCSDATSGIASCGPDVTLTTEGMAQSVTGTAEDNAGNTAQATVSGINIDKTDPTISGAASPAPNANGWNNTDVTVTFTCGDVLSGVLSCGPDVTLTGEGAGQSVTGTAEDYAGNSAQATVSGINIDKTAPDVSLVGGPADGGSYYYDFVPAAPTCSATDALSGLDGSCTVSGYSAALGTHTVTASATDLAGNTGTASATYTVLAWTLQGFFNPVNMAPGVWNTVKGGSTVPLKFRIFAGDTELTDVSAVKTFSAVQIQCNGTAYDDPVEEFSTTGGTSLRYDTTGQQFIQNWQTPKQPGKCYKVTMTTQDGSSISANFKLK
jgi:hypothetical protein